MKLMLAAASMFAVLIFPSFAAERGLSPREVFRVASPSVVVVDTYDKAGKAIGQGSGVVVATNTVVTNCHVFKGAETAKIRHITKHYVAYLRHADADRDLCSLQVPDLPAPPAQLGSSHLEVGERVYSIGAPRGFVLTLGEGLLSSLRPLPGGNILQVTTPISPGSSGGGLFDDNGRLIGITTLYYEDSQQLNFAVPVEWIGDLPARHNLAASKRISKRDTETDDAAVTMADTAAAEAATQVAAEAAAQAAADAAADAVRDPTADAAIPPRVRGTIYSYKKEGVRHYTSKAPYGISGASEIRATNYSFLETPTEEGLDSGESKWDVLYEGRWKLLYDDTERRVYLDSRSVKQVGNRVRLWSRFVYTPPTKLGSFQGVAELWSFSAYDCAASTVETSTMVFYSKSGEVLFSGPTNGPVLEIVPASLDEGISRHVCS